ncbi:MAG: hypothetical protein N6V41_01510, partial [Candidatus Portiera aleyrodidarum]|nr:hypothetical protein [Candidatus Portiera aleyrodidarum]
DDGRTNKKNQLHALALFICIIWNKMESEISNSCSNATTTTTATATATETKQNKTKQIASRTQMWLAH